jgi:methenyltetrahydrofolate cyclohydrolase
MGEMVINYSIGKKDLAPHQDELRQAVHDLTKARWLLLQLMQEDQEAYAELSRLRKLPEDSPERRDKLEVAQLACIRVPQAMAASAVAILSLCDRLAEKVNHFLLSDLAVCAELAMATLRSAIYNVRVNVVDLPDPHDRARIGQSLQELLGHGIQLIQRCLPRILRNM